MSKQSEKKPHELLEKVEHLIEEQPQQPVKSEPKPEDARSANRNRALMTYIAVLFGVAFVLVLLSFVVQMRDIDQLNKSADSALSRAELLQDENRSLSETNQSLQKELETLQTEKTEAEQALEAEKQTAQSLQEKIESMESQLAGTDSKAQEKESAYELLLTAQAALDREDQEGFRTAMEALAPLDRAGALGAQGHALYQELLPAYNEQTE